MESGDTKDPCIKSYTSVDSSTWHAFGDLFKLFRGSLQGASGRRESVRGLIRELQHAEAFVLTHTGTRLEGLDLLEIGPGQLARQMAYFGVRNNVVGIDLDVIPIGFDLSAYWQLLQENGVKRLLKTAGRKLLGFDKKFHAEMRRQLGIPRLPRPRLLQVDASKLEFPDASFDFVYSFDVFEHLPDCASVLEQVARVLRPGGCSFTSLHPITAEDGFHDLNIIGGNRSKIPYWAHLRPQHRHKVGASAYLNGLRLDEWREVFVKKMPGVRFECRMTDNAKLDAALRELRARGELSGYTDEELLARRLLALWRKPTDSSSPNVAATT